MRRFFSVLILGLCGSGAVQAQGLLVPTQQDVPPLALSAHEVKVAIEDQVAVTQVVQTFRNPTNRALEATYIFPVPKGASVKKFTMWIDGKEVPGELVEADKARTIYTDIVNRLKDPGLLEYMDSNLLKVRVFPVPAHGEQKLTVSYTSMAQNDNGTNEYIFPLKANGNAYRNVEKFTFEATIKDQQPVQSVYSPTHAISVRRPNEREAVVRFEGSLATLDKDFQLYYTATAKDVGVTALAHRQEGKDGHFMLLISPRAELSKTQHVPRDVVFVLDTSGSMAGKRIEQAKKAMNFCLRNLHAKDRFGIIHFATIVTKYQEQLREASESEIARAQKWINNLEATGSTNIDEALSTALAMRPESEEHIGSRGATVHAMEDLEKQRNFTIVFFTDGEPTIGETDPHKIVKNVMAKNTANTRIFTFGVGDDVNAVLLDQLAEKTRSVATYVRESEDIEAKVSNFYGKISHPVMTNLKVAVRKSNVRLSNLRVDAGAGYFSVGFLVSNLFNDYSVAWKDIYPQQLPDLFHGSQLVVLGRYTGEGNATVTLTGMLGNEKKEFTYDVTFPEKTGSDKAFVEDLWARRKVGYLLDQIRVNGEKKEIKDEVISLAKKYGITTPYTSYLVVPDVAPRVASAAVPAPASSPHPQRARNHAVPIAMPAHSNVIKQYSIYGSAPAFAPPAQGTTVSPGTGTTTIASSALPPAPPAGRIQFAPVFGAPSVPVGSAVYNDNYVPQPTGQNAPPVNGDVQGITNSGTPMYGDFYTTSGPAPVPVAKTVTKSVTETYSIINEKTDPSAQSGKEGVDLSLQLNEMRNQERVSTALNRQAAGRRCLNLNGVWTDDSVTDKMPVVTIKTFSAAYFAMLKRHPQMKEVFQLGNRVVWVTPSQTVLVVDAAAGEERLSDEAIDRLFVVKK